MTHTETRFYLDGRTEEVTHYKDGTEVVRQVPGLFAYDV